MEPFGSLFSILSSPTSPEVKIGSCPCRDRFRLIFADDCDLIAYFSSGSKLACCLLYDVLFYFPQPRAVPGFGVVVVVSTSTLEFPGR